MSVRERFHKDFVIDVISILEYYDAVSENTGDRFRESLERWLDIVLESPEAFAKVYKNVRAVRLRSFPYVLLYEAMPEFVYFIGVVHGASDQQNWFRRVE